MDPLALQMKLAEGVGPPGSLAAWKAGGPFFIRDTHDGSMGRTGRFTYIIYHKKWTFHSR